MATEPTTSATLESVRAALERLQREHPAIVVSGDWAGRLRLGTPAPYRLELIVDPGTLELLSRDHPVRERLEGEGRYRIAVDGVEVRLLVAGEACIGDRLGLPVQALAEISEVVGGVRTLSAEGLFATRMATLLDKPDTKAAEQDRIELNRLLGDPHLDLGYSRLAGLLQHSQHEPAAQRAMLAETFALLGEEDGPDRHGRQRLQSWERVTLAELDRVGALARAQTRFDELAAKQRQEGGLSQEERREYRSLYYALQPRPSPEPGRRPPEPYRDRGPELSR